jgi:hypothetical protein
MNYQSTASVWATAVSRDAQTERSTIFRYLVEPSVGFSRTRQPVRVVLVWGFQSDTGMPTHDEVQRMDKMEHALERTVEKSGAATLAIVATGEGLREWTYYAVSENEFLAQLNRGLSGHDKFPIEIHVNDDPEWLAYQYFKEDVVTKPD